MSGHLNPGGQQFRDDDGAADPRVTAALAAYYAGQGSEQDALTALAAARLLVPVIAVPADGHTAEAATEGDKNSQMVLPTLIGRDGRPAVLAFTGLDTLARWRPNARPVPAAYEDGDVRAEIEAAVAAEPVVAGVSMAPSHQVDLAVRLHLSADSSAGGDWQPAVNHVAQSIAARLAGRLRRGVEISVTRDPLGS